MNNIPTYEKRYSYSIEVLLYLHCEYSTITTKDAQDLLYLSETHSSNVLRHMWRKGWVERRIEYTKPHGRHFIYTMAEKGYNLLEWLDKKGIIDLPEIVDWH